MRYIMVVSEEACIESNYGTIDGIRAFESELSLDELNAMAHDIMIHNGKDRYTNRKSFYGVEITNQRCYDTVVTLEKIMTLDDWFNEVKMA